MSIVNGEGVALAYGARDIFADCSFKISAGDRIGLVGPNGSGKTSLLRLIAGEARPTEGSINRARGLKIGYVPQQPQLSVGLTVYNEVSQVFAELRALEDALLVAAEELAGAGENAGEVQRRYEALSQRFEHEGGYTYEAEIRRTLQGLGVLSSLWSQPVEGLSGGERSRVALARALLEQPDLLLLDEPTNHLDLVGITWLENLLKGWRGAFLVVSHDRYFLDQVVNQVWETTGLGLEFYPGAYREFEQLREERRRRLETDYEEQREFIERQEELIRRYEKGQRAKWAKGLEKRLQHIERIDAPRKQATVKLDLGRALRSGRAVLTLDDVAIAHPGEPERVLMRLPQKLEIERQARIAIVGSNGCGKTTLLRTIVGEEQPAAGRIVRGYNVQLAYYRQGIEHLDESATVLEELLRSRNVAVPEARNLLARYLFRGDDIEKRVGMLSGGERSRLALAKLSVSSANFLLLDEPTNHLDIPSREALEQVLTAYGGTVLVVSHDRRFIDTVSTLLWVIEDGELTPFDGSFGEYMAAREQRKQGVKPATAGLRPAFAPPSKRTKSIDQTVTRLEETVAALETVLGDLSRQLEDASARQDAAEVARLGRSYVETEQALTAALEEWEAAAAH